MTDITRMLKLLSGEHTSFTISYNEDHACNYVSAKEFAEKFSGGYDVDDFLSPEEFKKAMDDNSVWCAHWYPHTPVGFNRVYASSLEALMEYIDREIEVEHLTSSPENASRIKSAIDALEAGE